MTGPRLDVRDLACGHGGRTVVRGASFSLAGGEFLCLLGPNGAGKTTLFKTLLRLLPPRNGCILIDGDDVSRWSRRRFATVVGYVPQAHMPPFPFAVLDVVVMGRTAHLGALGLPGQRDIAIADAALDSLGIAHLRRRRCTEISGGERQMVLLARALVQQPAILVLDEPTANLDFGNQIRVLQHVAELADAARMGVVMTTHDPNHALLYATRVATIGRDGSFAVGTPSDMVTNAYLRDTYQVDARLIETSLPGGRVTRMCVPVGGTLPDTDRTGATIGRDARG